MMKVRDSSHRSGEQNKEEATPKFEVRLVIFVLLSIVLFGVLLGRLWYLQVLAGEEFKTQADENRLRTVSVEPVRGVIFDRNGEVVATNRPALALAVVPAVAKEKKYVVTRLADLLDMGADDIRKILGKESIDPFQPMIVKEDVDEETIAFVKEHQRDFPGVEIQVLAVRDYPLGSVGAHVLGYVGEISEEELNSGDYAHAVASDTVGKMGIEKSHDELTRGKRGEKLVEVDAVGRQLRVLREKEPQPGRNLVLTVDTNIQAAAERAVARGIRAARREGNYGSRAGAAVVMDVRNGEVLALASVPTFDPRQFIGGISEKEWKKLNAANLHPLSNRATNGLYPPGSTFKVVTGIAALETGLASMGSNFYCSGSWNKLGDRWSKACWNKSGHRGVTLAQGLVVSCDSVFYDLGLRLHQSGGSFQDWARRFGLGKKTGIDLPAEAVGRVPDAEWKKNWNRNRPKIEQRWYGGDTVNMAIGQGDMLTTPLQMASVYASIANGGQVVRPHLLKEVLTAKGNLEKTVEPELKSLGVPADKVLAVQDSLRNVVRVGTARDAFAGFPVATSGKTGTAEVKGKGDFAWFVGYAPSENPKYAVSVVIEEGGHGGAIAAPVVRNILDAIFSTSSPAPEDINDKSR